MKNKNQFVPSIYLICLLFLSVISNYANAQQTQTSVADEVRHILQKQSLYLKKPYPTQWQDWQVDELKQYLLQIDKWASLGRPTAKHYSAIGIGANLYKQSGKYWLLPYQDAALMQAGIKDRVELMMIDDLPITQLTLAQVGKKLKKTMGQPISLGICPVNKSCKIPLTVVVSPQPYRFHSVQSVKLRQHQIIRLLSFTQQTPRLLQQLSKTKLSVPRQTVKQPPKIRLSSLPNDRQLSAEKPIASQVKQPLNPMYQPVIIDLRDNWGGDLIAALNTASLFLPEGDELVDFVDKQGKRTPQYSPQQAKIKHRYPLLLLVSQRTASAGEIFAGILAHHGIAIVIGEQTFGKCVSQTERKLSDGQILHFTNLEIQLPDKQRCQAIGIAPQRQLDRQQVYDEKLLAEILNVFIEREIRHVPPLLELP